MSIIESGNPTVGLYFNDKLVSWAVTYPMVLVVCFIL